MRADRLISMMLMLSNRDRMTAAELADALEVSERTIYRDIEALSMAGVPVYTQSGPSGGLFLDEHYRVSLTNLSQTEMQTLFIAGAAEPLRDLGLDRKAEDAALKLLAALPTRQRDDAERLRQRVFLDPSGWYPAEEGLPHLPALQRAVWEDHPVTITYSELGQTLGPDG
jgi:predicted DNA-binding transcriptional regulator YafY